MAATLADVRDEVEDLTEPYLFSDSKVQRALTEAAEDLTALRGIDIDTILGRKAHRLMAAVDLLGSHLSRVRNRPAAALSESGKSITYVDLAEQKREKEQKLETLLEQLSGCPFEAVYDNY